MPSGRLSPMMGLMELLLHDRDGLARAAELLRSGRPVAFPTETVYGLGARACDEAAVRAVFRAKGRPPDNPLIVHVATTGDAERVASEFPRQARLLADAFWPGPLTLVLPRSIRVPALVSAGLSTVAVRLPAHPVAVSLIELAGFPLAAPSANRSGRPSPTTAAHVRDDLEGRIDAVVDGGPCAVGVESTVILCGEGLPKILRPGGVSAEMIAGVLGQMPEFAGSSDLSSSPGTRHHHYRPSCAVRIYVSDPASPDVGDGIVHLGPGNPASPRGWRFEAFVADEEEYARRFYDLLRAADKADVNVLYLPWPGSKGLGAALRDRIARCAGMKILQDGLAPGL